jgi:hypothetical protein
MPSRANDLIVIPDSFWQRPQTLTALRETAHEEVAGRPSVHRVVRQLVTAAPPTLRRDAEQFAAQIGVSR